MLDFVRGTLESIDSSVVCLRVGSIGLSFFVPSTLSCTVGQSIMLYTHLHWNPEQGPTLYGFVSPLDRSIFLLVISCSGVGPKLGLSVLSDVGALVFVQAIQTDDAKTLSSVSGIGPKKAEQIIVHLRHKVAKLVESGLKGLNENNGVKQWGEVTQVLTSLHYSRPEIDHAMKQLKQEYNIAKLPFDQLMRKALSFLSKKR